MGNIVLSFRDYAIHFFPGCVLCLAVILFQNSSVFEYHAALIAISVLIGGYLTGFAFDALISLRSIRGCIDRYVYGELKLDELRRTEICKQALGVLKNKFGKDFVFDQEMPELIYYMLREINSSSDYLSNFLSRINALETMAQNLWIPVIFLGASVCVNISFWFGLLLFVVGIAMVKRRLSYRDWFAKSVLRSYVAINSESKLITV